MAKIAEIVEASTATYVAQCYDLFSQPTFGSLVKTNDGPVAIYGAVYNATTSSIEPGRRPVARGRDEPDEEALFRANPQLKKLLRSEFNVVVLGYQVDSRYYHYLPPNPARIHGFVQDCSREEAVSFSQSLEFLSTLVNARLELATEEVTGAVLRSLSTAYDEPRDFLKRAGKELSTILSNDYNRLRTILSKMQPPG
jgi:hypothetical protein